jgi:hypothetical protein
MNGWSNNVFLREFVSIIIVQLHVIEYLGDPLAPKEYNEEHINCEYAVEEDDCEDYEEVKLAIEPSIQVSRGIKVEVWCLDSPNCKEDLPLDHEVQEKQAKDGCPNHLDVLAEHLVAYYEMHYYWKEIPNWMQRKRKQSHIVNVLHIWKSHLGIL